MPPIITAILDAIADSEMDSTPGIPLNYYNSKKGFWCERKSDLIRLVISRLILLLITNTDGLSPSDLIKMGLRDPIYTFIKDEPHKAEKLKDNRLRVISGVSLVDNIIERVLFSTQNKIEIQLNEHIPYKPGMGLHDDGQKALYSWFQRCQRAFKLCSTDVSAWDWSVPGYLMDMEKDYRLATGSTTGGWATLVSCYMYGLARKVFQLPSGEMFEQTIPGIQASGTYITSSGNSHMRHMLASLVQLCLGYDFDGVAEGCQMGDDALERFLDGLLEMYVSLGFKVKGVSMMPDGVFSFCSTFWDKDWRGQPESWTKTLFRFLFKNPGDPLFESYRQQLERDLRHYPNLTSLLERVDVHFADFK